MQDKSCLLKAVWRGYPCKAYSHDVKLVQKQAHAEAAKANMHTRLDQLGMHTCLLSALGLMMCWWQSSSADAWGDSRRRLCIYLHPFGQQ